MSIASETPTGARPTARNGLGRKSYGAIRFGLCVRLMLARVSPRGRSPRLEVYHRLRVQIAELRNRMGGIPNPQEAADIWRVIQASFVVTTYTRSPAAGSAIVGAGGGRGAQLVDRGPEA